MNMLCPFLFRFGVLVLMCLLGSTAWAQYTLLLPDEPTQDTQGKNPKRQMDVLLALMEPFTQQALDMDMPQMLAVGRVTPLSEEDQVVEKKETGKVSTVKMQREELLSEIEEIRYGGKKAWAAHVSVETAGLYQLITETRPRWDGVRGAFEQQFVKTILPVTGLERGWDAPSGLTFEILPLTRPFGLMAPALFTGKVVLSGEAHAGAMVQITRFNTEKRGLPGPWHVTYSVKTNTMGEFSFVCPLPGWWAFLSTRLGDPLKGPDGQPRTLEIGAVLWVYVDDAHVTTFRPPSIRRQR